MNQRMLVSVAVPVYNSEKYILDCLNSIILQTYSNIEIIIVDDGSSDDSLKICKSYKDKRIKIIEQPNLGLSVARQNALDNSNGDYICFVDSDDKLDEEYVEKMLHIICEKKADICLCGVRYCDKNIESIYMYENNSDEYEVISNYKYLYEYDTVSIKCFLSDSWNKMYRKKFIIDSKVLFRMPMGLNGTDKLFNHILFLHEPRVVHVQDILYTHIIRENSMVTRKQKNYLAMGIILANNVFKEIGVLKMQTAISIPLMLYASSMRGAMQDAFDNSNSYKAWVKEHQQILNDHKEYSLSCDFLYKNKLRKKNMALYLFWLLKKYSITMYLYFQTRGKHFYNNQRINTVIVLK